MSPKAFVHLVGPARRWSFSLALVLIGIEFVVASILRTYLLGDEAFWGPWEDRGLPGLSGLVSKAIDLPMALLDASRSIFLFIGAQLFAATVYLAWSADSAPAGDGLSPSLELGPSTSIAPGRSAAQFLLFLAIALAFFRWPAVTTRHYMNQDESMMIAGALTLKHDPAFWRSVESTTSGPLNYYALLLPAAVGLPIDHATARIVALALSFASIVLSYLTLRQLFPETVARMGVLPAWATLCCLTFRDYVHYSSEQVAILLVCAGVYLAVRSLRPGGGDLVRLFTAGCVLGSVPFAKLQAVPTALFLAGYIVVVLLVRPDPGRWRRLVVFGTAGLMPLGAVIAYVYGAGLVEDFWTSYVLFNLDFVARRKANLAEQAVALGKALFFGREVRAYFLGSSLAACLMVVACLIARKVKDPESRGFPLGTIQLASGLLFLLLLVPIVYSLLASGRVGQTHFLHYELMLIFPTTWILGWLLGVSRAVMSGDARTWRVSRRALSAGFVALAVLPSPAVHVYSRARNFNLDPGPYYRSRPGSAVAARILAYASRDQPLAVWGWAPQLHTETQMRQATAFAMSEREVGQFRQAYFRAHYIIDMLNNRPTVFVDETGPASKTYADRARYGHEIFPELRDLIRSRYRLAEEVDGVRIYVRRAANKEAAGDHSGS